MTPMTHPAFEYVKSDEKGLKEYKLHPEKLNRQLCHVFVPAQKPMEELMMLAALEYLTFHPNTKQKDLFNHTLIKCGGIEIFWCRFPKEFKDSIEKIGRVYGLTLQKISRAILYNNTLLKMPADENLLVFQTEERNTSPQKILKECDLIKDLGNSLERLGVD